MSIISIFFIILITIDFTLTELCENSVDISNGTHEVNGDIHFDGVQYGTNEYYTINDTEWGCVCSKKVCVQKCCPNGFGYNAALKKCVIVSDPFQPAVYDKYNRIQDVNVSEHFHFNIGKINCSLLNQLRIQGSRVVRSIHLTTDGNLLIEIPNKIPPWQSRGPDKYCIDTFVTDDDGEKTVKLDALVCFPEDVEVHHYILSSTCMVISCVFILATVGVYAWLPDLHNLHGWVLMSYLLSFFFGFSFLATMQILLTIDNITQNFCVVLTILIYFTLLSAFFWLNVMSFDIWWTFSGKRGLSLSKMTTAARYRSYAIYAFGFPTVLTILLTSLEFSGLPANAYLPRIRDQGCFLFGTSKLLYLYGPIVILCVANMVFFTLTAIKIASINRQTSVLQSKESASTHDKHRKDRQRLLLYVKLFAVMGINWIMEVVSSLYPDLEYIWRYTDAYNVLIGLIIFIIFVCKRKIFRLMKKRIKQKIHKSDSESTDLKHLNKKMWINFQIQRGSLDTIRTSSCNVDSV